MLGVRHATSNVAHSVQGKIKSIKHDVPHVSTSFQGRAICSVAGVVQSRTRMTFLITLAQQGIAVPVTRFETTVLASVTGTVYHRGFQLLAQRGIVLFVVCLMLCDTIIGFIWLQPALFAGPVLKAHQAFGIWTACCVFLTYTASTLHSPGRTVEYISYNVPGKSVLAAQYDNCIFCRTCRFPKPPQAHHCRTCGSCIMDMDHHCMFLANCVGRNNLRHFLTFLAWLLVGAAYLAVCTLTLLCTRRTDVWQHFSGIGNCLQLFSFIFKSSAVAPGWLQAAILLVTTSCAAIVAALRLLKLQCSLILQGQTYIDSLKSPQMNNSVQYVERLTRFQKVFGSGHPVTWMVPRWHTDLHVLPKQHAI